MVAGLLILVIYGAAVWLVFFKLKLLTFSMTWGVVSSLVGIHILLIFLIGIRFMTPYSTDARVIQHTIQLIPRLPDPTMITDILVRPAPQRVQSPATRGGGCGRSGTYGGGRIQGRATPSGGGRCETGRAHT